MVRTDDRCDIEVRGVLRGYDGLINNKLIQLNRRSVSGQKQQVVKKFVGETIIDGLLAAKYSKCVFWCFSNH
ncbi:MAG TPA: hypothetical protein EYP23_06515 [Thermoplasmata archaeon]|nr:hypothetical protein [Thermoplasmata archaeon]